MGLRTLCCMYYIHTMYMYITMQQLKSSPKDFAKHNIEPTQCKCCVMQDEMSTTGIEKRREKTPYKCHGAPLKTPWRKKSTPHKNKIYS